jgi:hypothetical protein
VPRLGYALCPGDSPVLGSGPCGALTGLPPLGLADAGTAALAARPAGALAFALGVAFEIALTMIRRSPRSRLAPATARASNSGRSRPNHGLNGRNAPWIRVWISPGRGDGRRKTEDGRKSLRKKP